MSRIGTTAVEGNIAPTEFHNTSEPLDEVDRLVRQWETADRCRAPAFLRERREKHERFWRDAPRRHPTPPIPTEFTFDAAAVLQAVTALAEHAVTGTITAQVKQAWAREHAALFKFPALEIADHVARCAKFETTVVALVASVLGISRVEAGLEDDGQ